MTRLYDILLLLDSEYRLVGAEWEDLKSRELYEELFSNWIRQGEKATAVFPLSEDRFDGTFVWDEDTFFYKKKPAPGMGFYLFLKKQDDQAYLFARALDYIQEGVQIYDKNACAVYFNKASRRISQIPDEVLVEGRHLLDMYNLDENISTIMTCLRTQSPVINRVDHYKSSNGISIATANTAYPIRRGKELAGAVVFEQSSQIVKERIKRMGEIEKALKLYDSHASQIRFSGYSFEHVIGHGKKLERAVSIAKRVAKQDSSVMLVGETGTGKEIFAQSIHRESLRKDRGFVALNCAAIPEALIESLLFGTQKGSFTGSEDKAGYFEEADGGTLFLDELNSMSLGMQSKILRAIQERTFRRVGSQKEIRMDVRIISSCNEDPFRSIASNQFRKDLFYRLSTVMIELPPLREHIEDLEELIRHHLQATAFQYVRSFSKISPETMKIFQVYAWPGNVRELFHVLDYAQNVADSEVLLPEHLPGYLVKGSHHTAPAGLTPPDAKPEEVPSGKGAPNAPVTGPGAAVDFTGRDLQSLMDEYECQILMQALEKFGYNITKTAEILGIRRQSLQYRIRKYGLII